MVVGSGGRRRVVLAVMLAAVLGVVLGVILGVGDCARRRGGAASLVLTGGPTRGSVKRVTMGVGQCNACAMRLYSIDTAGGHSNVGDDVCQSAHAFGTAMALWRLQSRGEVGTLSQPRPMDTSLDARPMTGKNRMQSERCATHCLDDRQRAIQW